MMCLVDTNVVLRWSQSSHPDYPLVRSSVETVVEAGNTVWVAPQNLVEGRNVLTRPLERNGFGLSPQTAQQVVADVENFFLLAEESPLVYPEWKHLVASHSVRGIQVHDARLAAVMAVHGITHILTFNGDDFRRYPGVTVIDPRKGETHP